MDRRARLEAMDPPVPVYVLRTEEEKDIMAVCFISAEDNGRITEVTEPALFTGNTNGNILCWDLVEMRVKYDLGRCHDGKGILTLFFADDKIFSHGQDGILNTWMYNDEWTVVRTFLVTDIGLCGASFFMKASNLALIIPSEDSMLNIIDYESGDAISAIKAKSHGMCTYIKAKLHKDTTYVFCGFEDGFVIVWNSTSETEISALKVEKEMVVQFDIDLDYKKRGVSCGPGNTLQVWLVSENFQLSHHKKLPVYNPGVNTVALRPDGKILVSGGLDGVVNVFSWKTLYPLAVMFVSTKITCIRFSNCTDTVRKKNCVFASGCKDGTIPLWSIY